MTNQPDDALPESELSEEDVLRKRLVNRIAVAAVVIVALLGGLAVIDALYVPPAPPPAAKMAEAPSATKASESPVAEPAAEEPKQEQAMAEPEQTATPSPSAVPKELKPLTVPAQAKTASLRPTPPLTQRPEPAHEAARVAAAVRPGHNAPPSKPLSEAPEPVKRFVVQMGVFNNVANAEELRSKLEAAHIPVQIEARVQVGPFATKADAEAARTKLAAMGMDPGILMANRKPQ